ncbi:hypothetical protein BH10PSE19_BH10PSE19_06660 [soil metagenome]
MQQQVSLREINQHLARYIAVIEQGNEVVITRRGKPIAKLSPLKETKQLTDQQKAAWERTLKRLDKGYELGNEPFNRAELYDRS